MTLLTSGGSSTDTTSYTTASITPSASKLILAAVVNWCNNASTAPTIAVANGLTWVEVLTNPYVSGDTSRRITLFRAMGAAPTTGAYTITTPANTFGCHWAIIEFGNVNTGGTHGSSAVVQSAEAESTGSTTITVTLGAFGSTNNATFGCFGSATTATTWTPGTGFTEISDGGSDGQSLLTEWRVDNDTSVDATASTLGGVGIAGIAIEIAEVVVSAAAAAGRSMSLLGYT